MKVFNINDLLLPGQDEENSPDMSHEDLVTL